MKKTKVIKTTYQLKPNEIVTALRNHIKQTLKLSDDIDHQSISFQPILGENTELIGCEIEFTKQQESYIIELHEL